MERHFIGQVSLWIVEALWLFDHPWRAGEVLYKRDDPGPFLRCIDKVVSGCVADGVGDVFEECFGVKNDDGALAVWAPLGF